MKGIRLKETAKTGNPDNKNRSSAVRAQFNDNYFVHEIENDDSFKMPLIVWLLLAPFLGLFYGIFLPFAWIIKGLITVTTLALKAVISKMSNVTVFSWNPVKVYFLGKKEERKNAFSLRDEE